MSASKLKILPAPKRITEVERQRRRQRQLALREMTQQRNKAKQPEELPRAVRLLRNSVRKRGGHIQHMGSVTNAFCEPSHTT